MADVDRLRAYKRSNSPSIPDSGRYVAEELKRIEITAASIFEVMRLLETRIRALEPP